MKIKHLIIGAGPAGLSTAYELVELGEKGVLVLDKNDRVGGLARTEDKDGYKFDIGPHRFFTKNEEIQALWQKVLGKDFVQVDRLTRIFYKGRLFRYPIQITDLLTKLSLFEIIHIGFSFMYAKVAYRNLEPKTFEEWITKNFGSKLFNMFFKTYTEKVWGIPCDQIGAEWASQRIKNLNFTEVFKNAIRGKRAQKKVKAKSLVEKFWYPVKGAGQMYEKMASLVEKKGGRVSVNETVTRIETARNKVKRVVTTKNGKERVYEIDGHLYSSMPLTHFIAALKPQPNVKIIKANNKLYYRDHITVNLVIDCPNLFDDNWVYIHSPEVKMARIANYNNFSKKMLANVKNSAIGVEYFVFKEEELWQMRDDELVNLAVAELKTMGLLKDQDKIVTSLVTRESESYPTYYQGHKKYFDIIKKYVDSLENVVFVGRGGQYKYNNQDHSMMTGLLAARKVVQRESIDPWAVNEDAEYHEEQK